MDDTARLTQVIEPEAEALGFDLVRVRLFGTGADRTLQVMAEDPATGQLVVDQCMALSRRVSDAIDAAEEQGEELVTGSYHLEVSSPGIDRPLTRPGDYARWAGHQAKLTLATDGERKRYLIGDLVGIDGETVTIEDRTAGRTEVALDNIAAAKLVLTDKLIAATKPIDMTGADEIEELEETPDHEISEEAQD